LSRNIGLIFSLQNRIDPFSLVLAIYQESEQDAKYVSRVGWTGKRTRVMKLMKREKITEKCHMKKSEFEGRF
jgi:hypothetical protein